jgi:hypothetical protein
MQSRHDFVFYSTGVKGKNSGTPALEKKKENIRERERERERRESEKSSKKILHVGALAYTRKKQSRAQILSVCERELRGKKGKERGKK